MELEQNIGRLLTRLLVLEPHPDDFILMCGATARKLRNRGIEVYVITFTNGGAIRTDEEQVKLERNEESKKADEILGTNYREILDYPVRGSWNNSSELYNQLLTKIRQIRPDTIITMHYDRLHPDHMWISTFIKPLVYQVGEKIRPDLGEPVKPRLFLGENPRSQLKNPDTHVDVTETLEAKINALKTQTSQLAILGERIFQNVRALASYRAIGLEENIEYCEAFQEIPVHYKNVLR